MVRTFCVCVLGCERKLYRQQRWLVGFHVVVVVGQRPVAERERYKQRKEKELLLLLLILKRRCINSFV
jgi:hypothetical protein